MDSDGNDSFGDENVLSITTHKSDWSSKVAGERRPEVHKSKGSQDKSKHSRITSDEGSQANSASKPSKEEEEAFELLEQTRVVEAVEKLDALIKKQLKKGNPQTSKVYLEAVIQRMNETAMKALRKAAENGFEFSLKVLAKAEEFTTPGRYMDNLQKMRNLTLNNVACVHRRAGDLKRALRYLERALSTLAAVPDPYALGMTYINLSAVHSQGGRHENAREEAMKALLSFQEAFVNQKLQGDDVSTRQALKEHVKMLVIAYHNLGVEEDFLGNVAAAVENYEKGFKLLLQHQPENKRMIEKLEQALAETREKVGSASPKKSQREKKLSQVSFGIETTNSTKVNPKITVTVTPPNVIGAKIPSNRPSSAKASESKTGKPNRSSSVKAARPSSAKAKPLSRPSSGNEKLKSPMLGNFFTPSHSEASLHHPITQKSSPERRLLNRRVNTNYTMTQFTSNNRKSETARFAAPQLMSPSASLLGRWKERDREDESEMREIHELERLGILNWSDDEDEKGKKTKAVTSEDNHKEKRFVFLRNMAKANEQKSPDIQPLVIDGLDRLLPTKTQRPGSAKVQQKYTVTMVEKNPIAGPKEGHSNERLQTEKISSSSEGKPQIRERHNISRPIGLFATRKDFLAALKEDLPPFFKETEITTRNILPEEVIKEDEEPERSKLEEQEKIYHVEPKVPEHKEADLPDEHAEPSIEKEDPSLIQAREEAERKEAEIAASRERELQLRQQREDAAIKIQSNIKGKVTRNRIEYERIRKAKEFTIICRKILQLPTDKLERQGNPEPSLLTAVFYFQDERISVQAKSFEDKKVYTLSLPCAPAFGHNEITARSFVEKESAIFAIVGGSLVQDKEGRFELVPVEGSATQHKVLDRVEIARKAEADKAELERRRQGWQQRTEREREKALIKHAAASKIQAKERGKQIRISVKPVQKTSIRLLLSFILRVENGYFRHFVRWNQRDKQCFLHFRNEETKKTSTVVEIPAGILPSELPKGITRDLVLTSFVFDYANLGLRIRSEEDDVKTAKEEQLQAETLETMQQTPVNEDQQKSINNKEVELLSREASEPALSLSAAEKLWTGKHSISTLDVQGELFHHAESSSLVFTYYAKDSEAERRLIIPLEALGIKLFDRSVFLPLLEELFFKQLVVNSSTLTLELAKEPLKIQEIAAKRIQSTYKRRWKEEERQKREIESYFLRSIVVMRSDTFIEVQVYADKEGTSLSLNFNRVENSKSKTSIKVGLAELDESIQTAVKKRETAHDRIEVLRRESKKISAFVDTLVITVFADRVEAALPAPVPVPVVVQAPDPVSIEQEYDEEEFLVESLGAGDQMMARSHVSPVAKREISPSSFDTRENQELIKLTQVKVDEEPKVRFETLEIIPESTRNRKDNDVTPMFFPQSVKGREPPSLEKLEVEEMKRPPPLSIEELLDNDPPYATQTQPLISPQGSPVQEVVLTESDRDLNDGFAYNVKVIKRMTSPIVYEMKATRKDNRSEKTLRLEEGQVRELYGHIDEKELAQLIVYHIRVEGNELQLRVHAGRRSTEDLDAALTRGSTVRTATTSTGSLRIETKDSNAKLVPALKLRRDQIESPLKSPRSAGLSRSLSKASVIYETVKQREGEQIAAGLKDTLLERKMASTQERTVIYEVVYNGDADSQQQRSPTMPIGSPQREMKSSLSKKSRAKDDGRVVRVDIDADELQKFMPRDEEVGGFSVKDIVDVITSNVRLDKEGGTAQVDWHGISRSQALSSDRFEEDAALANRQVLLKTTKKVDDSRYLIIVNQIERIVDLPHIGGKQGDHSVYQQFERLLEVEARCLNDKSKEKLLRWRLTFAEGKSIAGWNDGLSIAKHLVRHLQIYDNRFLLLVQRPIAILDTKHVIVFNEHVLRMLQHKIRHRRYFRNYESFKKLLSSSAALVQHRGFVRLGEGIFNIVILAADGEATSTKVCVYLFDIATYDDMTRVFDLKDYEDEYLENPRRLLGLLSRCLFLEHVTQKEVRIELKHKMLQFELKRPVEGNSGARSVATEYLSRSSLPMN